MVGTRRTIVVAVLCALPAGGCGGCFHLDFSGGFDAGTTSNSGCGATIQACQRVDEIVPHGHIAQAWWIGGCMVWCDNGFYDCDGNLNDGCESTQPCSQQPAPPPPSAVYETPLLGDPEGLALCNGITVVITGGHLAAMVGVQGTLFPIATVLAPPGGVACSDHTAYFGQAGGVAVFSEGQLLEGGAPSLLVAGDPGRGILVDLTSNAVYWRAASDGGASLMRTETDGATTLVAPVDPTTIDLPFALGPDGTYVAYGGGLARLDDAGASSLISDAGITLVAAGDARVTVGTLEDGGVALRGFDPDAGLGAPQLTDDVRAVVASGSDVFVATSQEIWRLPSSGTPQKLATAQNDVADLAVDGTYVAWTSRGDNVLRAIPRPP